MASAAEQMAANISLANFAKATDLKKRLWFTMGALIVFRLLSFVPLPGIDPRALSTLFNSTRGGVLDFFNMFSGGGLERMSLIALGVMPYITASIVVQLASSMSPSLAALKKEGESGRKKLNQYTRYGTVLLCAIQGYFIAVGLEGWGQGGTGSAVLDPGMMFRITTVISLVGGLILFICFMERAQRRVLIQYPKRQTARGQMQAERSHLPLKLNTAGVIPPIFASSLLLMPLTIAQFAGNNTTNTDSTWNNVLLTVTNWLQHGAPLYMGLYAAGIIFFCFFYTAVVFNPEETAENLKRYGGFIPGIRPGKRTEEYLDYVLTRITVVGAAYLSLICLLPEFLIARAGIPFYLGGTSLLIVVNVTMDTVTQIQSHLIAHQYGDLIKKAKLKGGRGR
jgi:preprotein translocase subunit SecY